MATQREQMMAHLENAERTPRELSGLMRMSMRDTLDHLEHVKKSAGKRMKIRPARCKRCGFTFSKRSKLSTPSRCPDCRNERILGPWLQVTPE